MGLLYYEWDFYYTSHLRFFDPSFSRSNVSGHAVFEPSFSRSKVSGHVVFDPSFSRSKSAIVAGIFDPSFSFCYEWDFYVTSGTSIIPVQSFKIF